MISQETIQHVVNDIVKGVHPFKVILFGSYARGTQTIDSDLDILVVSDIRGSSSEKIRRVDRAISVMGFGIDIIVRTRAQVRKSLQSRDWFVQEVFEHGKILYDRKF